MFIRLISKINYQTSNKTLNMFMIIGCSLGVSYGVTKVNKDKQHNDLKTINLYNIIFGDICEGISGPLFPLYSPGTLFPFFSPDEIDVNIKKKN